MKRKQLQGGFSLIEVLIAATVFAVGMLALVGMQYTSIYLTTTSNNRFIANNLVQQVMEVARAEGQDTFSAAPYTGTFDTQGKPATGDTDRRFTRQVAIAGNTLTVRVSWQEKGEVKHVTSSSLIF